jgi:MFS family permease
MSTIDGSRARWGLLSRNGDFARLWFGESVSAFGTQVTMLALPLLAVTDLGASAAQMGLLGAAETTPFLLFALLAGVWVDRRRKRPLLMAANVGRAVLLALIPLLAVLGILTIGKLVAIAFALGSCAVLFEVAYQSYVPRLVDREDLVEANSRLSASESVAEIGGPGLGGVLAGALTAPVAIAADAVSFLVSATSLAGIRSSEPDPDTEPDGGSLAAQIREGVRETVSNRYLLAFGCEAATYNVAWSAMNAILVLWAVRELGLDAATLGLLLSVGSVGALLGALVTGAVARRVGVGRAMWTSALVSNSGVLLIPLAGGGTAAVAGILGTAFFIQGLGATATNVHTYAIRQAVTPDHLMGRTTAVYRLLTHGFVPLGALLGGLLGETLGLRPALGIAALALFPSWLWLYCSPARSLRDLGSPARDLPDAAPA